MRITSSFQGNTVKKLFYILLAALVTIAVLGYGALEYNFRQGRAIAAPEALAALEPNGDVYVDDGDDWLLMKPAAATPTQGVIVYAGAGCDIQGYAEIMRDMAAAGYLVAGVKSPFNYAIYDMMLGFDADKVRAAYPDINDWVVIGHSMGGYGALNLVMNRPGIFSVVWALSPCCLAAVDDLSFGNDAWQRAAKIKGPEDLQELIDSRDFYPIAALGLLAAFSPDVDAAPIYGKFPFDVVRGEIVIDDVQFDKYLDALPVRQVRHARKNLRSLHGLALDVGLGDQFLHIPTGTLEFSQRLGDERIPHLLDIYAGDHRQFIGERLEAIVIPWVADRVRFETDD